MHSPQRLLACALATSALATFSPLFHSLALAQAVDDDPAEHAIAVRSVIDNTADAQLESNKPDGQFGYTVAASGDLNGDGFGDVVVGAPGFDDGSGRRGAAFVFFGGAGTFDTVADAQLDINSAAANFGASVAGAGDVNGDGYADIVVGADLYNNGQGTAGAAFIYFGGPGAFDSSADAQLATTQTGARFGSDVAGAGDVNNDGFDDVIIGAEFFDTGGQGNEGAAFVYLGGAGAFDLVADARLESNLSSAFMGNSVAGAGDVNGDGFADVVVGAWGYSNPQNFEGAAYVFFGGAGKFDTSHDALIEENRSDSTLGRSVSGAGDVNGDGFDDVIVGAPTTSSFGANDGKAYIYLGGAGTFDTTADAHLFAYQASASFGWVSGAGDVNGDGFDDVIVGAHRFDNGEVDEGAAFVFFGGAGPFNNVVDAQIESNQATAFQGLGASGAGDVNGDGIDDVIVGASSFDSGETDEGAAFLYFGEAPSPAVLFANGFEP